MEILNSTLGDIPKIFELYRVATEYMKSKNQVSWPEFERELIENEIMNSNQWKLLIDGQIACIWATTLSDELIWGKKNDDPSLYIHRIATNPEFRGQRLVKQIVHWADDYCIRHGLQYVRMDTAGPNKGLIKHYENLGFKMIEMRELADTNGLPEHYSNNPICLFQREPLKADHSNS